MQRLIYTVLLSCVMTSVALADSAAKGDGKPVIGVYGGTNGVTQARAPECGVDELYPSIHWYEANEWLSGMVAAAHRNGIKVIPSLASAYDGIGDERHEFAKAHPEFLEKRRDGVLLDKGDRVGLSWVHPEVRAYKVKMFTDLVKRSGVDGVLLDYTRFFGNDTGYNDTLVQAFKREHHRDPFKIATDDPQWVKFRAAYVTAFVRELRASLDALGRDVKLIACVNPNPAECLRNSLQDWGGWLDEGLIDGVTTMIYERDTNSTIAKVQVAKKAIRGRVPLIAMIAPEYDNLPTPELLRQGSRKCLQAGADGVGYYHEASLIRLGLWETVKEVANWDVQSVTAEPVDYALNGGFENTLDAWAVGDGRGVEVVAEGREGGNALRMNLAAGATARMIVDQGLISEGSAVRVAGWVKAATNQPARIEVDVTLGYTNAAERRYRVPVELKKTADWQPFTADVELANRSELKFVLLGLSAKGSEGTCLIDDVSLRIVTTATDSKQWLVQRRPPTKSTGETNVARGQVVRGSSFWENGYEFGNAVDGDLGSENYGSGSAWHSQRPAKDQWIKIYLPETQLVTRIRLLNSSSQAAYRTREYKVEVSTDDQLYRTVAKGTLPDDGATWTEIKIPPTPAKYVRFTGVSGFNPDYAVGLKEIELY
jgi:hypothetical protein